MISVSYAAWIHSGTEAELLQMPGSTMSITLPCCTDGQGKLPNNELCNKEYDRLLNCIYLSYKHISAAAPIIFDAKMSFDQVGSSDPKC